MSHLPGSYPFVGKSGCERHLLLPSKQIYFKRVPRHLKILQLMLYRTLSMVQVCKAK